MAAYTDQKSKEKTQGLFLIPNNEINHQLTSNIIIILH
jgi:hypothetical protein